MKKTLLPVFLFLTAAACADRSLDADIVKVFERHSYSEFSSQKITELLKSEGFDGFKRLDRHAEVVMGRKTFRPMPGGGRVSAGFLAWRGGAGVYAAKVFRQSPAEKAGLRDGDLIIELDGKTGPDAILERLRGGGGFKLKAERRTRKGPEMITAALEREEFSPPVIFGFSQPESDTAFVKIGMFYEGAEKAVSSGLGALARMGAKKVVFDLRDCAGGVPEEAAGILSAFAYGPGPVLEIRSRHKGYSRIFTAPARGRFAGLKTVILVNSGTAMAAEAFAAALRDLTGAMVMGETTKGDVSLKKTFRLGRGKKGLTLTIARMLPPSGKDLEGGGLTPDIKVTLPAAKAKALRAAWAAAAETSLIDDPLYPKAL